MQNNEKLVQALNELVSINYDRVFGYEKAIEEVDASDVDLRALFNRGVSQSRKYVSELQQTIRGLGGEPVTDSTTRGKLFRVWMDFKSTLMGKDRKSVLDSCAYGEEAALKAYDDALQTEAHLPDNIRISIAEHKQTLKSAHHAIQEAARVQEVLDK